MPVTVTEAERASFLRHARPWAVAARMHPGRADRLGRGAAPPRFGRDRRG